MRKTKKKSKALRDIRPNKHSTNLFSYFLCCNIMDDVSYDLLERIFSYLPPRFNWREIRNVCSRWRVVVDHHPSAWLRKNDNLFIRVNNHYVPFAFVEIKDNRVHFTTTLVRKIEDEVIIEVPYLMGRWLDPDYFDVEPGEDKSEAYDDWRFSNLHTVTSTTIYTSFSRDYLYTGEAEQVLDFHDCDWMISSEDYAREEEYEKFKEQEMERIKMIPSESEIICCYTKKMKPKLGAWDCRTKQCKKCCRVNNGQWCLKHNGYYK